MYDLTASAWDLGLVGLMQFIPALVLTIPAGQLVDRVDRRLVLGFSLGLQGVVALLLAWGSWSGWVQRDLILGLSVVLGIVRALQAPAQQAMYGYQAQVARNNQIMAGRLATYATERGRIEEDARRRRTA